MKKYLFAITLIYFALGLVNIHFAILGLLCLSIPLIILFTTNKKTWCKSYCPRADLFSTINKPFNIKNKRNTPKYFITGNLKWIVLIYFAFNLFIITMSTIMVSRGKPPLDSIRFLIFFKLPDIPQLFSFDSPDWVLHFSYRMYSMMFTTTIIGIILALVYKPRTWCVICPISTVSNAYLKKK